MRCRTAAGRLFLFLPNDQSMSCRAAVIGSDSLKGRVHCGGAAYWAITLSLVPLTGAVSLASAWVLVRNYDYKTRGGHDLPVGEVRLHCLEMRCGDFRNCVIS